MKNPKVKIFFGLLIGLLAPIYAAACTCVDLGESVHDKVSWRVKSSTVVFAGEAIKLEKVAGTRSLIATFAVDEFWKGTLDPFVKVKSDISTASCGYHFDVGITYLVYASGPPDDLTTGLCIGNGVRFERGAKEQISFLGIGKIPQEKKP